jgi:hypothetical protein
MAHQFEGRDYAFFEVEIGFQQFEVIRRVEDKDW